jgi:protein-tyrosine-phosphatase
MSEGLSAPHVLVVCGANVCRSVYAQALLTAGMAGAGVIVGSSGLSAEPQMEPCPNVVERCRTAGLSLPESGAREITVDELAAADLILVMTRRQQGEIAKRLLGARARTMTLIGAVALAEGVAARARRQVPFREWVAELDRSRASTPMPAKATVGFFRRPPPGGRAGRISVDIEDGHISGSTAKHLSTLDLVAQHSERLLSAWSAATSGAR